MTTKLTRLEDLAALAGVSISTVSRALNDSASVNSRTKQKIWQIAREHDYPFRSYMPAGPIGADGTITLVVPRPHGREGVLADPFFLQLFASVGVAAKARDCDVLLSHTTPTSYEDLVTLMSTCRSDGVVFFGQSSLHHAYNQLAQTDGRFVVWGAELPEQAYCSVGSDNVLGGRRAAAHLARLGRKRILFLGDSEAPEVMQRLKGYRQGLEQAGLEYDPALVIPAHFEIESSEASLDGVLSRGLRFDGVVAASDLIAMGAIRSLSHAGLRVPEDVSVVGYDDIPFARLSRPALTTVSQDVGRAGRLLVSKLMDGTGDQDLRSERVPTPLIIRESCGA